MKNIGNLFDFWPCTGSSRTGLSNGVWKLEIGPVVWEISGGALCPPPPAGRVTNQTTAGRGLNEIHPYKTTQFWYTAANTSSVSWEHFPRTETGPRHSPVDNVKHPTCQARVIRMLTEQHELIAPVPAVWKLKVQAERWWRRRTVKETAGFGYAYLLKSRLPRPGSRKCLVTR